MKRRKPELTAYTVAVVARDAATRVVYAVLAEHGDQAVEVARRTVAPDGTVELCGHLSPRLARPLKLSRGKARAI